MKTSLVIMAAGIGSRFGGGIKQMTPLGPNGELIIDYSVHDALEAGFNKVVFIIRKDLDKDFREIIGDRVAQKTEVAYVYQDINNLPGGFEKPAERTKPWGTGQAILACKGVVNEPFVMINADDYYGKEGFQKIHEFLVSGGSETTDKMHLCLAGFKLINTLSDNGTVTRGVCHVNSEGYLDRIRETKKIYKRKGRAAVDTESGPTLYHEKTVCSMNMWGASPDFIDSLESGFIHFLDNVPEGNITEEYLIPTIIGNYIAKEKADVKVLTSNDKWFGVTYHEDVETVQAAFRELKENGTYPDSLK